MNTRKPLTGTWYAHSLRYEFPQELDVPPDADVDVPWNVESAWRSEHEAAEITFADDGTWTLKLDEGSGDISGSGRFSESSDGFVDATALEPVDGYEAMVYLRREEERVALALEMVADAYDEEPIQVILFERFRPAWLDGELTLIEQLILRPQEADDLLTEADTEVEDVAVELWRAFADGRLRPSRDSLKYQAATSLLTWDGVCEAGIDDEVAAAIVKHVDAADEYNFASDLAPFIKEIVDQGATLELSDDWKELLQET